VTFPADERSARILFSLVPDVGPGRFRKIMDRFGSAAEALSAPREEWNRIDGLSPPDAAKIHKGCQAAAQQLTCELERLDRYGARVLIPADPEFPDSLKSLPDPPAVLYVRGHLKPQDLLAVAVVGTRRPSAYGRAAAERLARELAEAGITVVSGLASGIDTAAHVTALKSGGRTVGVLGSGFARFYPAENKPLFEKMGGQGAVISEFCLDSPPERWHFPARNRLIAALSLAVVVVEAGETSGALITARLAAEQGRDVFAVPGPIFSANSRGPNRLLKQGAGLAESAQDVLEAIEALRSLVRKPSRKSQAAPDLSEVEERLLACLGLEPIDTDALSQRSGLPIPALSAALLGLELKGLIRSVPGNAYVRSEQGLASAAV
jgi:DNA processing protein